MFGKSPRLTPLQSRKQLLVAESELNRAQLACDIAALKAHVRTLTDRAKSLGLVVSSVAVLVAGLAAFRRGQRAGTGAKSSWLKTILKGAHLISSFWPASRPPRSDEDGA